MPVKVMRIEDAPVRVMRWDRGKALRLVDEADGAKNVDVHINLINVDPECAALNYIVRAGRELKCEYVMSNNFAFGGINTSLIFKRYSK